MLDLSKFQRLATHFPKNVTNDLLKSSNNTFIVKYGRAQLFTVFVYSTPLMFLGYQIFNRSFSTYYQNFQNKTEFSHFWDFNSNSFVENNRQIRNSLEFN